MKRHALLPHLVSIWPREAKDHLYAAILCGEIQVNGVIQRDPKTLVGIDSEITRTFSGFVSRGGEKLDAVLDSMDFNPAGKICLDAGASTGGFTDCLLQRGAAMVYAVDSGYNQLAWKLKTDNRVVVRERLNIMQLEKNQLDPSPELAVADLSFRSLRGASSHILSLITNGFLLALFKPQFEGPNEENFDGVVRTAEARRETIYRLKTDLENEDVYVWDAAASPIPGRKGNAEIFLLLSNKPASNTQYAENRLTLSLKDASRVYEQ